jgi:hypothetical protein
MAPGEVKLHTRMRNHVMIQIVCRVEANKKSRRRKEARMNEMRRIDGNETELACKTAKPIVAVAAAVDIGF